MAAIRCRARVSKECYNGRDEAEVYDSKNQSEDGTWNGRSVVCDPCYIRLGTPPNAQLDAAIDSCAAAR